MMRTKVGPFLSLLLYFLQICRAAIDKCSSHQDKSLSCYSDYNRTINCMWNSSHVNGNKDDVCTLYANSPYNASCDLKPFDVSKPALKYCFLQFTRSYTFLSNNEFLLKLSCMLSKHNEEMNFKPACHIKVNPPGQSTINQTTKVNQKTVTWFSQVTKHRRIDHFRYQLQWKPKDKSWNDASVSTKEIDCKYECEAQLDPTLLIKDETYEARSRVRVLDTSLQGLWSDWSPTLIWVSQVGKPKPTSELDKGVIPKGVLTLLISGLLLTGILILLSKKQLIYVVKNFKSGPLPDPAKSQIFQDWFTLNSKGEQVSFESNPEKSTSQTWLISNFTDKCMLDVISYEVTSRVDVMDFCRPDINLMPESDEYDSGCSSFSNPSYSGLHIYPAVSSVELQACSVNAPFKPVQHQGEEENSEQDSDLAKKDHEMVKLLFMGRNRDEPVVISDYKNVEKQQAELLRLQSVDSGMCSCEEVSQESMETDSFIMTVGHNKEKPHMKQKEVEEKEGNNRKLNSLHFCLANVNI